jgi:hypothetical protein
MACNIRELQNVGGPFGAADRLGHATDDPDVQNSKTRDFASEGGSMPE